MAASNIDKEVIKIEEEPDIKCKVIKTHGEITHILSIQLLNENITLKIQIPESYPNSSPIILVRKDKAICTKLSENLVNHCESLIGENMLSKIIQYIKTNNENVEIIEAESKDQKKMNVEWEGSSKQKMRKPKIRTVEKKRMAKKVPMKTACDVVKRLQWDEGIDKDYITIGYVDRFKGIMEKPWLSFSWEDISSVDYYTFVIPRHRIAYFKWKKEKVWDKETRMDNVFGSTGSNCTIYDVIANYKEPETEVPLPQPRHDDDYDEEEFSDSDDDDVVVTINRDDYNRQSSVAYSDSESDNEVMSHPVKDYWQDKCRPNFFICVRIQNPEIVQTVNSIQDTITFEEPRLLDCIIPENMLHMTLLTLRLDSAEEVATCVQTLHDSRVELKASLPHHPLVLSGVGCFFGRVLYARIQAQDDFYRFAEHLRAVVCTAGLRIMDQHDFVAHMTLLKTNRPASRRLGSKNIDPTLYAGTENVHFGEQKVESVYLCSMEKERGPDGFYMSPGGINFQKDLLD